MPASDDVRKNVRYALLRAAGTDPKWSAAAHNLGVNRSTLTRWLSTLSTHVPNAFNVRRVAGYTGLDTASFYKPHQEFIQACDNSPTFMTGNHEYIEQQIVLKSIVKCKSQWDETFEKYRGSYFWYSRIISTAEEHPKQIAVSLLTINQKTDRGIEFEVHNNDTRETPRIPYVYRGLMFPVFGTLCFYGEEQSCEEVLNIITPQSQKDPPSPMRGYFIAVGVTPSERRPAGTKLLLVFKTRKHLEVDSVVNELGVFVEEKIPSHIREQI